MVVGVEKWEVEKVEKWEMEGPPPSSPNQKVNFLEQAQKSFFIYAFTTFFF